MRTLLLLVVLCVSSYAFGGHVQQEVPAADTVKKTVAAIGYLPRKNIDMELTSRGLMTVGSSQAKVKAGTGATDVEAEFQNMAQATTPVSNG